MHSFTLRTYGAACVLLEYNMVGRRYAVRCTALESCWDFPPTGYEMGSETLERLFLYWIMRERDFREKWLERCAIVRELSSWDVVQLPSQDTYRSYSRLRDT